MRKILSFFLFAGLMAWVGVANAQLDTLVKVGSYTDSSYNAPMSTHFKYSYTQMIYGRNYMPGTTGSLVKIKTLSFYYTGSGYAASTYNRKIVVYMKHVTTNYFSSTTPQSVSAADRVFAGTVTIPASAGWVNIDLQNEFVYENLSNNNLLIAIYDSTGTYNWRYFRQRENGGLYGTLSYRSDNSSSNPNPEAGSLSGYGGTIDRYQSCPDLKITYTYNQPATLPYSTNFSNVADNAQWNRKTVPDGKTAFWAFNSDLHCGDDAYPDYYTANHPVTALAERQIQLGNSDSIKVSFFVNEIGGEVDDYLRYDFLSVFLMPKDTNWKPNNVGSVNPCYYLGYAEDSILPYALYFGERGRMASVKLSGITARRLTATIANPYPGQVCKLVFVWRNDISAGDGTAARLDDLSVTEVDRAPEYTPQSTAQWYAYAYWLKGENHYPWQEHFLRFSMQNLVNVDTASAHFDHDMYSGTYAGGYVWYNQGDNDKITRANISNNFVSGSINYTIPTLTGVIVAMQYNPADNKMYFITSDKKLCSFDISDPEHYTVMGQLSISITAFAINAQGEAYVIEDESNGSLYRINLNNGTTTLVGSSGIHIEDYSAMAFDYRTGELFLALYDDDYYDDDYGKTAMYYVNTTNGEMKYIGKLLNRTVEITAMFAEQTVPQQGIASAQAAELSVYPNPAKDELHVSGVENGTLIKVYDMTGKLVAQQTATENNAINVSGLNKGVYVVAAGSSKVIFVKE